MAAKNNSEKSSLKRFTHYSNVEHDNKSGYNPRDAIVTHKFKWQEYTQYIVYIYTIYCILWHSYVVAKLVLFQSKTMSRGCFQVYATQNNGGR